MISDHYRNPRNDHNGVDIMFARIASDPYKAGTPNGSNSFVMPNNWLAVSAGEGVLWSAAKTSRGYAVVVDHGAFATFYQHLESLLVPEVKPPTHDRREPIRVVAGLPLGIIGADPRDQGGVKHLHFELWHGRAQDAIDPEPIMKSWEVFNPQMVAGLFPSPLVRNARGRGRDSEPDLVYVSKHTRARPGKINIPQYWRTKPGHGAQRD